MCGAVIIGSFRMDRPSSGKMHRVARRKNIFDFASKELSATAFWAWVLDAEHSDDAALRSLNEDLRLKLDVPADATLETIELEKNPDDPGLKLTAPSETDDHNDRKRIDILATYRIPDGGLLRLVVEHKIRRDPQVIEQVTGYRDRLQRRVTDPVRAAVFTFDNSLASSKAAADQSITVLTLSEMLTLIERHASSNAILEAYVSFLKDKLTVASASPVRGSGEHRPENLARWSVVANQKGIRSLLETYVECADRHGFAITHSKGRSIFLTIGNKSPIISVHPSKSSAVNGLWFGVSVTNLSRVHNILFNRAMMPVDFAWQIETQSGNEWRFGYLQIDRIEPTLRMVSEAIST
ncbi:MAG: PD-(D/E)XK nuclease family protein [Mycobacterium sp.]